MALVIPYIALLPQPCTLYSSIIISHPLCLTQGFAKPNHYTVLKSVNSLFKKLNTVSSVFFPLTEKQWIWTNNEYWNLSVPTYCSFFYLSKTKASNKSIELMDSLSLKNTSGKDGQETSFFEETNMLAQL